MNIGSIIVLGSSESNRKTARMELASITVSTNEGRRSQSLGSREIEDKEQMLELLRKNGNPGATKDDIPRLLLIFPTGDKINRTCPVKRGEGRASWREKVKKHMRRSLIKLEQERG